MQYFDIIRKGAVIGQGCRTPRGSTVSVWAGGEEHCQDFYIKNRYDLKMSVNFWISQIEQKFGGETPPVCIPTLERGNEKI